MASVIEKRHVRGRNTAVIGYDDEGNVLLQNHEFHDYVPVELVDAYVADAKTRWQYVEVVSDDHDAGPAGDKGATFYPEHLNPSHPLAGKTVNSSGKVVN